MTCGATGESLDLILLDESLSELELIPGRLVVDAEHLRPGTDVPFGMAMTVDAPFHLQRLLLPHQRHPIHRPVTRRAADALVHVNTVVEIDEIRQIVATGPLNRLICAETLPDRLEKRTVRKDLRVTVHAGARCRNAGERRVLDRRMTVAAVDSVPGDVALVAELDRLLARDMGAGHPWRPIHFRDEHEKPGNEEHGPEDADPRDRIGTAMKDLRHRS